VVITAAASFAAGVAVLIMLLNSPTVSGSNEGHSFTRYPWDDASQNSHPSVTECAEHKHQQAVPAGQQQQQVLKKRMQQTPTSSVAADVPAIKVGAATATPVCLQSATVIPTQVCVLPGPGAAESSGTKHHRFLNRLANSACLAALRVS